MRDIDSDSEENQEATRQNRREVFALQMQAKADRGENMGYEDEDYCQDEDGKPTAQEHNYVERLSGVKCMYCGHFVGNWE